MSEALWHTFEIFVNVFENAVICYFIQKHFHGRFLKNTNNLISAIMVITVAAVYTVFLYAPPPWIVNAFVAPLFWILYAILFRKGLWYEKSFWSVLLLCASAICGVIAVSWAMFITGATQNAVVFGQGVNRFILVASAKAAQCVIYYYFSKLYTTSPALQRGVYISLLALPVLCLFIVITLFNAGQGMAEDSPLLLYKALASVCVMAILMIIYYMFHRVSKQSDLLIKTQRELHHRTMMEQHNEELIKIDANMRTWRHNFHNHLQTLLVLSRNKDNEKFEKYVSGLGQKLDEIEGVCHTGQKAFDAIVTVKCAIARSDGITVNINITPVPVMPINDVDVTSLVGNLFDNAIEACRKVDMEKRSIDLFLGLMGSMLCIRLINTTDGLERVENGRFLTTKADKGIHGLGLVSVDRIVAAADGLVNRKHENGMFTTEVLLPLQ